MRPNLFSAQTCRVACARRVQYFYKIFGGPDRVPVGGHSINYFPYPKINRPATNRAQMEFGNILQRPPYFARVPRDARDLFLKVKSVSENSRHLYGSQKIAWNLFLHTYSWSSLPNTQLYQISSKSTNFDLLSLLSLYASRAHVFRAGHYG